LEIGRRIVEHEQAGRSRAGYGAEILKRLSTDLGKRFGRGFGFAQLNTIRQFYLWRRGGGQKVQSVIGEFDRAAGGSSALRISELAKSLRLSWTHYVRLLRVRDLGAQAFYETEAVRGGWSVRQLDRQIDSQFYQRTALSRDKAAMLLKGGKARPGDRMTPEQEIKDPYVLEFLGLKDEYSESELEDALVRHLESFLLELGGDFTFVARQKRLRVGDEWYRVDLVFFHRTALPDTRTLARELQRTRRALERRLSAVGT